MGRSFSSYLVPGLAILSGFALMGSSLNLARYQWAADHRTPSALAAPVESAPPADAAELSPEARQEVLQRRLQALERRSETLTRRLKADAEVRASARQALLAMMVSAGFMCLFSVLLVYQRRRQQKISSA